ncbi:MAG: hypothetical protein PHD83_03980, partial [Caldisericia bacterium]|nr:hypothetical protein [Caldisericia bacterium]
FDILLRLLEMGIEPYLIATSLSVLVSERLVRKVCTHCSEKIALDYPFLNKQGIDSQLVGKGCAFCHYTGYHGRQGVFEVVRLSAETKKMISGFSLMPNLDVLQQSFQKDCLATLQENFFALIRKGVTNWEEVLIQLEDFE